MSLEAQMARVSEHNRRCVVRIKCQRAEIRRLLAERAGLLKSREALERLLHDLETVPRTVDGVIARPGLEVYGDWGTAVVRKVCDGGEQGYTVEIEDASGPQGWVPLSRCWSMPF